MRIIDRYVVREALLPAFLGLLVFTFLLIIPLIIQIAEELIAKGVPGPTIATLMALLLPSALGLSIPMSLLVGLLVAFGRLSGDREFVAMQACGISLNRMLRPAALLSLLAFFATLYVLLVALPDANQAYRETTFNIIAERTESEIKPGVFFEDFSDLVLYVREASPRGGWKDVFMADTRPGQPHAVYLAREGRVAIDRHRRTVEMVLDQGTRHVADTEGKYEVSRFDHLLLSLNPDSFFERAGPPKGEREMSITELRDRIARLDAAHLPTNGARFEIQKKFSIPAACLVLGLIAVAVGLSNRRDGRLASFVVGTLVIFAYYVVLWFGQSLTRGSYVSPWLAAWLPNIVLGLVGIGIFVRRLRAVDRPLWAVSRVYTSLTGVLASRNARSRGAAGRWFSIRLPLLGLLDRYVAATYARTFALSCVSLAGIFYISTFLDLSDKVFRGDKSATWTALLAYFWYATPQYIYYVVPIAVLLATLVTIGLLTKSSEIVVMKACGISLYRVALPLLVGAALAGTALILLQETILGPWNRQAEAIRHLMRGGNAQTFDVLNRRWVVGQNGDIYHYVSFNPREMQLNGLSIYHFDDGMEHFARRTFAERARFAGITGTQGDRLWRAEQGWTREFTTSGETRGYEPFSASTLTIEPVAYFSTQTPNPDFMNYTQLRSYTARLQAGGFDVTGQKVALSRKMAFPLITLIMTLIAVPFAVTTGRRGALYGIGIGIALALIYWGAISVFAALGTGGLVAPALAAWAPNLLFGAGAAYLLFTVRT